VDGRLARLLCFGMSRNGVVQQGRMRADPYEMVCPDEFIVQETTNTS
jgi:hypothetical protein